MHEALVTETRHFGVLLEIPRLQIKGLVKSDKLPGGRWVYEAFASRWKNDHGSVLCAGLRVPEHSHIRHIIHKVIIIDITVINCIKGLLHTICTYT